MPNDDSKQSDPDSKRISWLIQKGLASKSQIQESLKEIKRIRKSGETPPSLEELLVQKGILTSKQAEHLGGLDETDEHDVNLPGYRLLEKLGEGGMGEVYRGYQINMARTVAIKLLREDLTEDEEYVKRFHREARTVAKVNHRNIIQGYDVGSHEGTHYFVMEYVDGETLDERVEEEAPLPVNRALEIMCQMADALVHADKHGLVHRDIKPANIMINDEGTAKLCDLGLAKVTGGGPDMSLTGTGELLGTPFYMSPEQIKGRSDIDIKTDVYSLGATFYHLITGEVPYSGTSAGEVMNKHITDELQPPKELIPDLSDSVDRLIRSMMVKEKEGRPSPEQLVEDLENLQDGTSPVHVPSPDALEETEPQPEIDQTQTGPNTSNWFGPWSFAGGLLFVITTAGIVYSIYAFEGEQSPPSDVEPTASSNGENRDREDPDETPTKNKSTEKKKPNEKKTKFSNLFYGNLANVRKNNLVDVKYDFLTTDQMNDWKNMLSVVQHHPDLGYVSARTNAKHYIRNLAAFTNSCSITANISLQQPQELGLFVMKKNKKKRFSLLFTKNEARLLKETPSNEQTTLGRNRSAGLSEHRTVRMKLAYQQKQLTAFISGQSILTARVHKLKKISAGFWLNKSQIKIQNLLIQGHLHPDYIENGHPMRVTIEQGKK